MANRLWEGKREALREVLKELRAKGDLTQAQLADRLSKPQSYVSKYESGERKLDFIEVLDVVDSLGVESDTFLSLYYNKLSTPKGL